jgi:hypothetical protein
MSLTDLFAEARTSMDAQKGNYFYEPIPIPLDAAGRLRRLAERWVLAYR